GGRGDAPGRGSADRLDAREHRELLQPVTRRDRWWGRQFTRSAAGLDPRDRLSAVAAARDARPPDPALLAGRLGRGDRRVVDGRRRAVLARGDRPVARRGRPDGAVTRLASFPNVSDPPRESSATQMMAGER